MVFMFWALFLFSEPTYQKKLAAIVVIACCAFPAFFHPLAHCFCLEAFVIGFNGLAFGPFFASQFAFLHPNPAIGFEFHFNGVCFGPCAFLLSACLNAKNTEQKHNNYVPT